MSRVITIAAGLTLTALLACQRMKPVADVLADARKAHDSGEDRAAVIHLKNLLQQEPGHGAARRMLGELHLAMGDAVSAEKELRRALALGQPRQELLPLLVRAMLAQASWQGVLDELQADPLTPAVLAWRGHALLGLGKAEDAGQLYTQALHKDDKLVEAHLGQARLALLRNDTDAAGESVQHALAADPHNSETLRFQGTCCACEATWTAPSRHTAPSLNAIKAMYKHLLILHRSILCRETRRWPGKGSKRQGRSSRPAW